MNKVIIETLIGAIEPGQAAIDSPNARIATVHDGRQFYVKSPQWHGMGMPIRLANELFYYVLAGEHGLPMPNSAIVLIDGVGFWGSQRILNRQSLTIRDVPLAPEMRSRLKRTLRLSAQQRKVILRCMFLDLLLLNTDRTLWNLLGTTNGDFVSLDCFDHDRTFGWHGDPNHVIRTVEEIPFQAFLKLDPLVQMAVGHSSRRECNDLFAGLSFNMRDLDRARSYLPEGWISNAEYDLLANFMEHWWTLSGALFRSKLVYTMFT